MWERNREVFVDFNCLLRDRERERERERECVCVCDVREWSREGDFVWGIIWWVGCNLRERHTHTEMKWVISGGVQETREILETTTHTHTHNTNTHDSLLTLAMADHLFPKVECAWTRSSSSSLVQHSLRMLGCKWFTHLSLHCLPDRSVNFLLSPNNNNNKYTHTHTHTHTHFIALQLTLYMETKTVLSGLSSTNIKSVKNPSTKHTHTKTFHEETQIQKQGKK